MGGALLVKHPREQEQHSGVTTANSSNVISAQVQDFSFFCGGRQEKRIEKQKNNISFQRCAAPCSSLPACLHPSVILFLCFSTSHPPGRRNVETKCFKNSILSCDRRCHGGSAALWCEKQECEDGCRPRRAAGPIHAHHQGPQNRRQGFQERVRLFFRLSRKCACRPPSSHTHSLSETRAACLGRESAS